MYFYISIFRSQMSATRTNAIILLFWAISVLCGFSDFFIPSSAYTYCSESSTNAVRSTSCTNNVDLYDLFGEGTMNMTDKHDLNMSFNLDMDYTQFDIMDELFGNDTSGNMSTGGNSITDGDIFSRYDMDSTVSEGFCYNVMCSRYDTEYLVYTIAVLLLLVMSIIYTKVCVKIYSMQHLLQGRCRRSFRRNKKGLITTMCIVGTFMVCWLPFCIFSITTLVNMSLYTNSTTKYFVLSEKLDNYLYALLLLNCLCDPVIYALRMREVKLGYRRLLGRCFKKYKHNRMASDGCSSSYEMTSQFSLRAVRHNTLSVRSSVTKDPTQDPQQSHQNIKINTTVK